MNRLAANLNQGSGGERVMNHRTDELELKVLFEISRIIGQALELDRALGAVPAILEDCLSMKRATITLWDEDREELRIRVSHGLTSQEKRRGVYQCDEGLTGLIFAAGEPAVVPDVGADPLFLNRTRARRIDKGRISFIGVPIMLQGKPVGVLSVDRLFDENVSFDEDVRFLTILAAIIAQLVSLNTQVRERERKLDQANRLLKEPLSAKCVAFFKMAESPSMLEVQQLIRKVAPTRASVLLLGESGTGKTLVAQIIHELGARGNAAFVKMNCAAVPENLLESELFGHEKGAFTGASERKTGRVEEADGGTLFLDEIGELASSVQAKLLRFLQDKEFERLGGAKTRKVDARIIAATNRDMAQAVREGAYRADLYYRLNVFPIKIPSLRERREDIPRLIGFFCEAAYNEYGRRIRFRDDAIRALQDYSWPGNVREMENLVERLVILSGDAVVGTEDLKPYIGLHEARSHNEPGDHNVSLAEIEKAQIIRALDRNKGVQSRAAAELGITLRQMGYKIRKYGLAEFAAGARALRRT
jgi:Nif-specific regulatory protein